MHAGGGGSADAGGGGGGGAGAGALRLDGGSADAGGESGSADAGAGALRLDGGSADAGGGGGADALRLDVGSADGCLDRVDVLIYINIDIISRIEESTIIQYMSDSNILYKELLKTQFLNSSSLIKTISPPTGGFTIIIKDQRIIDTVDGNGWVHPKRRSQYITLFENLLK